MEIDFLYGNFVTDAFKEPNIKSIDELINFFLR